MPTTIFKLVMSAVTTTNTDTNPAVEKYFYNLQSGHRVGATTTIPATSFSNDAGDAVTSNLVTVTANDGYYLLFVNGVLQQSSLFTVSASEVVISNSSQVPVSAPITLAVNNFAPTSTSTTTVTT